MSADTRPDRALPTEQRRCTPVLALDVPDADQALALCERLPRARWVKVGLQLFTAAGPDLVRDLRRAGRSVFLDLKLHDIPNTVARAVEAAAALDVQLLTLHAVGGRAMLRAAREAADGGPAPRLLAVTMLTSLSPADLAEVWGRPVRSAEPEVLRLAALAHDAGMDGVVASAHEVPHIREHVGADLLALTPGIRLAGDAPHDQQRVATPEGAVRAGADFLVIGRAVTAAPDPEAALDAVFRATAAGESGP